MALDLQLEDSAAQSDASGDKSCLEKWVSAPEAIADWNRDASGDFECNICLDSLHDPVLTLCGHLFCWPCIYKWLYSSNVSSQKCPVCKLEISQSSLVPVYGRIQITTPSKGKNSHNVGTSIPPRPRRGPVSVHDLPRSYNSVAAAHDSQRSYDTRTASRPATQFHQLLYPYQTQQFNAFDTTHGVFGQMIYARVFGSQLTNMYASDSYGLAVNNNNNPRVRRHLIQVDKSLSRICLFLFCCTVLCLLLF